MLEYARWKYYLVAAVLLLGLLFASPNFFGQDPALQVARKDHAPVASDAMMEVETFLKDKKVRFERAYTDNGRLMVRFANVSDQLAARDAVDGNDNYKNLYITALSFAPRTPGFLRALGLRPMSLGLDLRGGLYLLYQVDVNSAVNQALEGYAQDARRALTSANISFKDVTTISAASSGRPDAIRIVLPTKADVQAARNALSQPFQGLSVDTVSLPSGSAIEARMTPAQIKERQDYAIQRGGAARRGRGGGRGGAGPGGRRRGGGGGGGQRP